MQEMVAERESPLTKLMSGLKDASAAGSGGRAGPTAAIQMRDEQKAKEAAELFKMRTDMATLRSMQSAGERQDKVLDEIMAINKPGAGQQPSGGAVSAPSGQPVPDLILKQMAQKRSVGDKIGAQAIYDDWVKTQTHKDIDTAGRAESYSQEATVYDRQNGGVLTKVPVIEVMRNPGRYSYNPTTQGANTPALNKTVASSNNLNFDLAVNNLIDKREGGYKDTDGNTNAPVNMGINKKFHPDVDVKNLTRSQAVDIYKKQYWDAIGADNLSPAAATVAFDAAVNQGPAYAKKLIAETGGDPDKMLAKRAADYKTLAASDKTQAQNLSGWNNRLTSVAEEANAHKKQQPISAPSEQSDYPKPTGNRLLDEQNIKDWEARRKQNIEVLGTEQKKSAEKAGERQSAMIDNAQRAHNMEENATAIINIASDPKLKGISGISKQGMLTSPSAALSNVTHGLGYLGTLGHMSEKEADEIVSKSPLFSREERAARDALERASASLGVDYAAQIFHGARMGIGLENMAMKTKGVGTEYLPETNLMHADIIREGARFNKARHSMWIEYKSTHGGDNASFAKFEEEPAYRALEDQTRATLAKKYPKIFSLEDDARVDSKRSEEPKSAPSKFDKFRKKQS
jgi:lysozyme family protein